MLWVFANTHDVREKERERERDIEIERERVDTRLS